MALYGIVYDETQELVVNRPDTAITGIVFDTELIVTIPVVVGGSGEISYVF